MESVELTPVTLDKSEMCECGATIAAGEAAFMYDIGGGVGYACAGCAVTIAENAGAES